MAASATFALKSGEWFRRVRFVIFAPDSHAQPCALSGRDSTHRTDRNCGATSVGTGIEHAGVGAVMGNAVALQIDDMIGQRRRPETASGVSDHASLRHHAARAGTERQRKRRAAPAAKARAMCPARPATEALAYMPGLLGGPHDLADERVRPAAVAAAVTNAAELDAKLVVTSAHGGSPVRQNGDGAERAEMLG